MTPPTLPSPHDDELDQVIITESDDDGSLEYWLHLKGQPVPPPQVDGDLPLLNPLERSAEVLRYTAQYTEHWLSPRGVLREWVRRTIRLALAVLIPLIIFAPVVTLLLDKLQGWSGSAAQIAGNLTQMPAVTATMVLSAVGVVVYRWLFR